MSKTTEIREICGDYAFDVEYSKDNIFTMFFNSRRNAETVKQCIEVDDGVPNVATAIDFVEVVRCKDCIYWKDKNSKGTQGICLCGEKDMNYGCEFYPFANDFCSYGKPRTPQNDEVRE